MDFSSSNSIQYTKKRMLTCPLFVDTDACNPSSSFQCTQIAKNAAEAHEDGHKALSDADLAISAAADKVGMTVH